MHWSYKEETTGTSRVNGKMKDELKLVSLIVVSPDSIEGLFD